jgi:predicted DCC family thiol-disulfide oxidoreductase YuxK
VSKRDRRGYFRFAPMQLAEGRPLAEQLGINPDRPDTFRGFNFLAHRNLRVGEGVENLLG